jgi:hypothetical protein
VQSNVIKVSLHGDVCFDRPPGEVAVAKSTSLKNHTKHSDELQEEAECKISNNLQIHHGKKKQKIHHHPNHP